MQVKDLHHGEAQILVLLDEAIFLHRRLSSYDGHKIPLARIGIPLHGIGQFFRYQNL